MGQSPAFGRKLEARNTKYETEAFEKTKPIAGLWPEARSTKPEILNRLAPSTTFRDGLEPRRRAQHEVSSLVVMAAKEGGIIYGPWFTEIRYIEACMPTRTCRTRPYPAAGVHISCLLKIALKELLLVSTKIVKLALNFLAVWTHRV